jgi:hypothetical protein
VKIDVTHKADITAIMGASGSGKSAALKQELLKAKTKRLLVFDPEGEYADFGAVIDTVSALLAAVKAAGAGAMALVLKPSDNLDRAREQFDMFCRIAYAGGNLTMVCEEIAFVTKPTAAPEGWSLCTLKGRKRKLKIYGSSQRPAAVDKNFFGNATRVRTGRLNYEQDLKTMANVLRVDVKEIADLLPLHYIERNMTTGAVTRGTISFPTASAPKSTKLKK